MPSVRSKIVRNTFKLSILLREPITAQNLQQKRKSYARLSKRFKVPAGTKITRTSGSGFAAEWVDTPMSREDTVMLYVHGGGFVFDSTEVHRELIARIANAAKVRALSLDYSLAPEHPFPKAVNEALAAYTWLLKRHPAHKIAIAGDSAGGSVVLSLLSIIREKGLQNPACAIALSPATDAYKVKEGIAGNNNKDFFIRPKNIEFFIDAYFQNTPRNHPVASPLYGNMKGFPPILIHSDKDELMNIGIKKFVEKAKKEGVSVSFHEAEGLWHVWHLFARFVPEARTAIEEIGDYIRFHTT